MNMLAAFDDTLALARARDFHQLEIEIPGLDYEHLLSMRDRITPEFSEAKLGRWLGWAQCSLVANGVASLEEMKEINKRHSDD